MCPRYILSDNCMTFKNQLMHQVLQKLGIDHIMSAPYHPQSNGKLEVFHKYLKPTLKTSTKRIQQIGISTSIKFLIATEWCPTLPQQKKHFSCLQQRPKPTITSTSGTNATISQLSRTGTSQPGRPLTSHSHCKENTRWELLQDCPENHG